MQREHLCATALMREKRWKLRYGSGHNGLESGVIMGFGWDVFLISWFGLVVFLRLGNVNCIIPQPETQELSRTKNEVCT